MFMQFAKSIRLSASVISVLLLCLFAFSSTAYEEVPARHNCFYPDSNDPAELNRHFEQQERRTVSERYDYLSSRWPAGSTAIVPSQGSCNGCPITLTWSVVPDGLSIPGMSGEPTSNSNLQSFLTGLFGSTEAYLAMFNQSFNAWHAVTGVSYIYEPNDDGATMFTTPGQLGVRGDIRIGGHYIDGNYGILAYTYSPPWGDMVIDTGDIFYSLNLNWMWQVVAHELGHALALAHTCPMIQTKLMEPYFSTNFIGPQHDDILGAQAYYGDRYEVNNQLSSSSYLGSLPASSSITLNTVSLHSSSDVDFYTFIPSSTGTVTITAYPTGQNYTVGGVGDGGVANSCSGTFPTVDTNLIYELSLSAYNGNQALITSSNAGSLGNSASMTIPVTAGQSYYVQVYTTSTAASSSNIVQMYNLTLSSTANASPAPSYSAAASSTPAASRSAEASSSPAASRSAEPSSSPAASRSAEPSSSPAASRSAQASSSPAASRSAQASDTPSQSPILVANNVHASASPSPSHSRRPFFRFGRDPESNEEAKPPMQVNMHPVPEFSPENTEVAPAVQVFVHPGPTPTESPASP